MIRLSDPRCQLLWEHSDTLALAEVHRRWPELLPEWGDIAAAQAFALSGSDAYQAADVHRWSGTDASLRQDFLDLNERNLRWPVIMHFLREWDRLRPWKMVDLGSYTGAHAVALSNAFPNAMVYAQEIVADLQPGIARTIELFAQYPQHIIPRCGDHRTLPTECDLIFCGEMFEHVAEWRECLSAIEAACRPGGLVILTTPIGPWERESEKRLHIAHWDAWDLFDVLGKKQGFCTLEMRMFVPGSPPLGWMLTQFHARSGPTGTVNYDRKLTSLGFPVETRG